MSSFVQPSLHSVDLGEFLIDEGRVRLKVARQQHKLITFPIDNDLEELLDMPEIKCEELKEETYGGGFSDGIEYAPTRSERLSDDDLMEIDECESLVSSVGSFAPSIPSRDLGSLTIDEGEALLELPPICIADDRLFVETPEPVELPEVDPNDVF